jgi:hypothetical protein
MDAYGKPVLNFIYLFIFFFCNDVWKFLAYIYILCGGM